jgi:hypothetical protein
MHLSIERIDVINRLVGRPPAQRAPACCPPSRLLPWQRKVFHCHITVIKTLLAELINKTAD